MSLPAISDNYFPKKKIPYAHSGNCCPFCGAEFLNQKCIFIYSSQDLYKPLAYENQGEYTNLQYTEFLVIVKCKKCQHLHSDNVSTFGFDRLSSFLDIEEMREFNPAEDKIILQGSCENFTSLYPSSTVKSLRDFSNLSSKEIKLIKEADIAFNLGLETAAAASYRSSLEFMTERILEENKKKVPYNLIDKINALNDARLIETSTKDKMTAIAYLGNDNIHTKNRHPAFQVSDLKYLFHSLLNDFSESKTISKIINNGEET